MSCINLPTVLPGSPSKTRGQIQVRAPGVGSWQTGAGSWPVPWRLCAVGPEVTAPSFLGDSRTHVLRKKVTASRGGGVFRDHFLLLSLSRDVVLPWRPSGPAASARTLPL